MSLNITPSIQSNISKPMMTMGIYGFVNMTLTYRVESDVLVNSEVDKCEIIPVALRAGVSDDVSIPSRELAPSPTVSFSEALVNCSPSVRPTQPDVQVDNETSDCECLTEEEAICYVAFAVFTTALILLMTLSLLHYTKKYWFKLVPSPTGEAILAEILEKRMLYTISVQFFLSMKKIPYIYSFILINSLFFLVKHLLSFLLAMYAQTCY